MHSIWQNLLIISSMLHIYGIFLSKVEAIRLSCYSCQTVWQFDDCVVNASNSDVQICANDEYYCMVNRNETNGIFSKFKRGCASNCRNGCGVWGSQDVDIESCMSCCSISLCNTGNGTTSIRISLSTILFLLFFMYDVN